MELYGNPPQVLQECVASTSLAEKYPMWPIIRHTFLLFFQRSIRKNKLMTVQPCFGMKEVGAGVGVNQWPPFKRTCNSLNHFRQLSTFTPSPRQFQHRLTSNIMLVLRSSNSLLPVKSMDSPSTVAKVSRWCFLQQRKRTQLVAPRTTT